MNRFLLRATTSSLPRCIKSDDKHIPPSFSPSSFPTARLPTFSYSHLFIITLPLYPQHSSTMEYDAPTPVAPQFKSNETASPISVKTATARVHKDESTKAGKAVILRTVEMEADAIDQEKSFHVFTEHTLDCADALRAELKVIREHGYGFDREEHEPGIICIAMPILSETGRVLGALSVTSTTGRTNLAGLEGYVPILQETAAKITREAQNWSFPDYHTKEATRI